MILNSAVWPKTGVDGLDCMTGLEHCAPNLSDPRCVSLHNISFCTNTSKEYIKFVFYYFI